MNLTEYVDALRQDLARASRAMGQETEQAAERLCVALDSSVRLAMMDALSHAAAEITNELDGVSVEVRLQGREPVFVVVGAGPSAVADDTTGSRTEDGASLPPDGHGETARAPARIAQPLQPRAAGIAGGRGQARNARNVRADRKLGSTSSR